MPLKYLLYKLADRQDAILRFPGQEPISLPLFEVTANPRFPADKFRAMTPDEQLGTIAYLLRKGQEAMALTMMSQIAPHTVIGHPYMVVLVRQSPVCLAAHEPSMPIYDPPAEWDDELGELVVADDAKVVGHTEEHYGWALSAILGISSMAELPEGFSEDYAVDDFPFWGRPLKPPPHMREHLATVEGQAWLAGLMTSRVGFSEHPPEDASTMTDLLSEQE